MTAGEKKVTKILITEFDIKKRIAELVFEIAQDFEGKEIVIISILKGSFMFLADLVRNLYIHDIHPFIDFVIASSYKEGLTSGDLILERGITAPVKDKTILLIDDILDTGKTLHFIKEYLEEKKPARIHTCVLLDKPSRREVSVSADYSGFDIEDIFVVGYGLDYNNRYRELPYIGMIE